MSTKSTSRINKKRGNRKAGRRAQNQGNESYEVVTRPSRPIYMGPPTYKQQQIRSWRIRCDVAANSATQTLTSANLASLLGIFSTGTTTSVYVSESFRLKEVHLWSWTSTIGTTADVELKLSDTATAGGQSGPPCTIGDSSASTDKPAYAGLRIPLNSIFARWQDVASTNPFLSYFSNFAGIMDLIFEFIMDDIGTLVAGPTLVAATANVLYHKAVGTLTIIEPLNGI